MRRAAYYVGFFAGSTVAVWLALAGLIIFVDMTLFDPLGSDTAAGIVRFLSIVTGGFLTASHALQRNFDVGRRTNEAKLYFASANDTRHLALVVHAAGGEVRVPQAIRDYMIELSGEYDPSDDTFVYRTKAK